MSSKYYNQRERTYYFPCANCGKRTSMTEPQHDSGMKEFEYCEECREVPAAKADK
jgi:hypothetical protein